jgi:hypothetical protein
MSITFNAESVSVESAGRSAVEVTIEADDYEIAQHLSDDSRLKDLDVDVVRAWLLLNDNHEDILEAIGLDEIHEFLSHAE